MSFTHLFPLGGKTNTPDILGSLEESSADVQKGDLNQTDEAPNMKTMFHIDRVTIKTTKCSTKVKY